MEGTLWKWTNYFSGWQPRWFVLENGVLSYYKSREDVVNGCKGSVQMSVCDVAVHPSDQTRLDLDIPGEAHFYVKAATALERQQWLLALGACKASLVNSCVTTTHSTTPERNNRQEALKSKQSELRLYCDLLMQKVHQVKTSVPGGEAPDIESLDDASSLLRATCDTFIVTLEECMSLSSAAPAPPSAPTSPVRKPPTPAPLSFSGGPLPRQSSVDRFSLSGNRNIRSSLSPRSRSRTSSEGHTDTSPTHRATDRDASRNGHATEDAERPRTLFSEMSTSFQDIRLGEDGGVPVTPFLTACRAILVIFDKMNSTAFAPVKMDIVGNIRKIQSKYSSDPSSFKTLQSVVANEVNQSQNTHPNSATIALLWLRRALEFIRQFLYEVLTTPTEPVTCVNTAYEKTLKQYHSAVVRGVFAVALASVPSRTEFLSHFAVRASGDHDDFQRHLYQDMDAYVTALDVVIKILADFYQQRNLDFDATMEAALT